MHVIQDISTRRSSEAAEFYTFGHIRVLYKNQRQFKDIILGFGKVSEELQRKENASISAKWICKGGNIAAIRELPAMLERRKCINTTTRFDGLAF